MKNEVKCYRCGKETKLDSKNLKLYVTCPHCHAKMVLDQRSKRYLKYFRYLVVILACTFIMFGLKYTKINLAIGLVTLSLAIAIAMVADRICLFLEYYVTGLSYTREEKK